MLFTSRHMMGAGHGSGLLMKEFVSNWAGCPASHRRRDQENKQEHALMAQLA